ncbi:hypothetical protein B0A52_02997 [Exophiala mesophila]|uniref:Uncharacterized protein n=1 Tax=Exophiala mesophila TaxID=212818 RepID=A0A438NC53_EXOME|nr:hypothetical protein B0A52_02997 [Exophiala mesophila]
MNGGLYCDNNGNIQKPFPDRPYCQSTSSNIGVQNRAGGVVSFCQTVLPGNEAMLIPTSVSDYASIAVPDPSYWCSTAAHYYINPPGVGTEDACVWGTNANPVGNWSPYVAGTNVDASGQTFIKLGWNPIYLEPTTPFRNEMPNWGVRIECPNGGCNGLPCAIDPTQNKVNSMQGSSSNGAGGGSFCVVTVSKGSTANFVVFNAGGDTSSNTGGGQGSNWGGSDSSTWANNNGAGQFYQSATEAPDTSSTVEAEATSTYTTSWAAETTTTSASASTTTFDRSWPKSNSTTYTPGRPSQSPHYSLFHTESAATQTSPSSQSGEAATTQAPSSTHVSPSIKTATGAASLMQASILGLVSSVALCLLASL